jgi:hypothetical protein
MLQHHTTYDHSCFFFGFGLFNDTASTTEVVPDRWSVDDK